MMKILQQRALPLTCAILILLSLSLFAYALWQWRADWVLAHQQAPSQVVEKIDDTTDLIATLPQIHLFGHALRGAGDMPISNLQLRVTGIVEVASNAMGQQSKAYISMAGEREKIFRVGDSLPYGVKIYAITADAIILENEGQLEKLPLARAKLQFKTRDKEENI